jgi:membrane protease YdiL (CAAX protease family)
MSTPPTATSSPVLPGRRTLAQEVWLVFALSLGASGLRALLSFVGSVTAGPSLRSQTALLNGSQSPGRPWLDLALQLTSIGLSLVPVLLVAHLLARSGERLRGLGLDRTRPRADLLRGLALAAVVGGVGLVLYLGARATGANLTVVPEALPAVWWRVPVLLLSAAQNALLEESLVAGYLLHRLRQLGFSDNKALAVSAVLRGSYHLYQGLGGFVGNLAMGLLFGRIFQRTERAMPLVVAHTLIDAVAFVGYLVLAGHVSWLPTPG